MVGKTATIRVPRKTRDLLAEQARARGMSLSSMLDALAHELAREAAFRSERDATLADASDRGALAEQRGWESALGDGVD